MTAADVRERRAGALAAPHARTCTAARAHPRWALVSGGGRGGDDADDVGASRTFLTSQLDTPPAALVRGAALDERCWEYPKLRRLLALKRQLVLEHAVPSTYLCTDLHTWRCPPPHAAWPAAWLALAAVGYDVILIDPPLRSYAADAPHLAPAPCWTWAELAELPVPQLASRDSFLFLWVGSGASDGLERGRELLARWGYRRCETIAWVPTTPQATRLRPATSLLAPGVQHCLMGIRGTVVRSTDSFFVHCNVDTDTILWPGVHDAHGLWDPTAKPPELYHLIENFCLGTRRLELFGRNTNLRPGWLTVGHALGPAHAAWPGGAVPWDPWTYTQHFTLEPPTCPLHLRTNLVPYSDECEALRPRSPTRRAPTPAAAPWPVAYNPAAARPVRLQPPRMALLGQGAGGATTVSRPSGDERLSGAQAHVAGSALAAARALEARAAAAKPPQLR